MNEGEFKEGLAVNQLRIDATLDAWTEFQQAIEDSRNAFVAVFAPVLKAVIEAACELYKQIQRACLGARLRSWLPARLAWWLADHWPARWLPHPKFDEVE